ncbi:insulinase family protein [Mucilaginibacter sp. UR6-1]|uniref:M16 family metallopeptidase n=1 Tax=Mucilaginibacter sp. UR6-1 TaxID=1435643 RepID=UPI001E5209E0|nr:insulinase family protein [Mucilaginibacter sp. UR6-1]MCC8411259.1 insulinase family protein [Mucilaginibacter sp. UR6-1]
MITPVCLPAQNRLIKNDPGVIKGSLPNGFRYYIKHNQQPAGRATIYLVTKAGAILEKENERGIAHFLEHMNFNGTKHFPKNDLISYLERAGVRFGADLNAYTAFDETVYQLPLPTDNEQLWKNGLLIMHDWANGATLSEQDFNSERGVILEEKRMRNTVDQRLQERYRRQLFSYSRYADRMPIGTESVIRNADVTIVRNFYKRWYRPDLQAIIISGDIDPKKVEREIKLLFADLRRPAAYVARPEYKVKLQDSSTFVKLGDPEYGRYTIEWYYKFLSQPVTTETQFKDRLVQSMISRLLSARFREIADREKPAYISGAGGMRAVVANMNALELQLMLNPERIASGVKAFLLEAERIRRFGFTNTELDRIKSQVLLATDNRLAEQDKINSSEFADDYLDHFVRGDSYPDVAQQQLLTKGAVKSITINEINEKLRTLFAAKDCTTLVIGPESGLKNLPDRKELQAWENEAAVASLKPYESSAVAATLIAQTPSPGKIVSETGPDSAGVSRWTLSNGAVVYVKPTNFKNDEVLFSAFRSGGSAAFSLDDSYSVKNATTFIVNSGVDGFSGSQLSQVLNGKALQVRPYINDRYEGFRGISSKKDLSTALALTNLYMTRPRLDTGLFSQIIGQSKAAFRNRGADPDRDLTDTITYVLSGYHPRRKPTALADFDRIDSAKLHAAFKERFSNPAGFNFIFVGNLNTDSLKKLVTTYIGSLPVNKVPAPAPDLRIRVPEGKIRKNLTGGKDNKASVQFVISGNFAYDTQNLLYLDLLRAALESRLLGRLREKEGGIYTPSVMVSPVKEPVNFYAFTIAFQCDPARMEELITATQQEVDGLARSGVTADELQKFVAEETRSNELDIKDNSFWQQYIQQQLMNGEPTPDVLYHKRNLNQLNTNNSRLMAAKFLSRKNELLFTQKNQ